METESLRQSLPQPVGNKILCSVPELDESDPVVASAKAAGIVMSASAQKREELATTVLKVEAVGPDAYTDAFYKRPWCKVGDYIVTRAYSGTRLRVEVPNQPGVFREYRVLEDGAVDCVTDDPFAIIRAY